jgi:hypothetical protein
MDSTTATSALLAAIAFSVTLSLPASAEPTQEQKAAAQALFDEGRAAMGADQVPVACAKFTESYQLDPTAGTLINLGLCHEREGKTGSAYTELSESVSRAIRDQRPEREKLAREHLAALASRLVKLTIEVSADAAGSDGFVVTVDGSPLAKAAWGVAVPLDPGEHAVEGKAPGRVPFRKTVTLGEGATLARVEVPALAIDPAAAALPPPSQPVPPSSVVATSPPPPASVQRTIAWSVIGAGAAGIAVGSIFGIVAIRKWSGASTECPNGVCRTEAEKTSFAGAGTFADVSTVAYVIGGIALATGAVILIASPRASSPKSAWRIAPLLGPGAAGLHFEGAL